jgi:hypothetical protein
MELERTPAWARLNRVDGGESRRTRPSRTTIQHVPLEVVRAYVPTDNGDGTIPQRFVTIRYIRIESNRQRIDFRVFYGEYKYNRSLLRQRAMFDQVLSL